MTAPFEIDVEAVEIEASHLLSVRCADCGSRTLAAPGRERLARCATCWGGSVIVPASSMSYTTPVGYPLWRREVPEAVRPAYPAPEVSSRDDIAALHGVAHGVVWPGAVEKLASDGCALHWDVRKTWARGCLPHATTGRPGAPEDSYAVRFARETWSAWAVYRGGAWKFVWMVGRDLPPFGLGGVTDLREWLADPEKLTSWYGAIRERARLVEVRRKEAAKSRPKKTREAA
jgi:hypothetical protein